MMRKALIAILCLTALFAQAQSFDSLKRSKGKTTLHTAIEQTLAGRMTVAACKDTIASAKSVKEPYGGKTPIYLVLDYLATHKKQECGNAEQLLSAFISRPDFDINLRYSSLLPPMAYLIRTNYDFLGGRFSPEYISNNVLILMISAGASVNTFNSNGGTLMDFAMDTGNRYLAHYFVQQGINLRHSDKKGEDAVYKLIADGQFDVLKQALDKGSIKIDINSLQNNMEDIARHKELYDYLANHCARQASDYNDIVLFRSRFANRKDLVKTRYEQLARNEAAKASKFEEIITVENRYPDLPAIVNPRKLAIYSKDCQTLQAVHTRALATAEKGDLSTMRSEKFPREFVENYSKKYQYDPNNKVSLAREVEAFYTVCEALDRHIPVYDWKIDHMASWANSVSSMFSALTLGLFRTGKIPEVSFPGMEEDERLLRNAISACNMSSQHGYGQFFSKASPVLRTKLNKQQQEAKSVKRRYEAYEESIKAKSRAEMARQEAQREAKRKREEAIAENPDVSLKSIGITYTTGEWDTSWIDKIPVPFDTPDHQKTKYLEVKYSDGTKGCISKVPSNNYYVPSGGEGFLWDDKYTNLSDAIAAEYFFRKYDVTRTKGKK